MLSHNPICILDGRLLKGGNQVLKRNLDLTGIYSAHIWILTKMCIEKCKIFLKPKPNQTKNKKNHVKMLHGSSCPWKQRLMTEEIWSLRGRKERVQEEKIMLCHCA